MPLPKKSYALPKNICLEINEKIQPKKGLVENGEFQTFFLPQVWKFSWIYRDFEKFSVGKFLVRKLTWACHKSTSIFPSQRHISKYILSISTKVFN